MAKRIVKYNPAFLSKEELVSSFVVRHAELELILQVLRENVTKSNQHVLIIGPRGIGKTMLALRVVEQIREDEDLRGKWYPLVFGEESYQVSTPGEFWLEALFHLAHKRGDEQWMHTYEELRDERYEDRLRERALAQLMDFADSQGKRILLVVENFNMLLGEQISDSGAWKLRHTLLHEPRVMLLATATSRFKGIDNADKAMFDLFKACNLEPLDEKECGKLWTSISGKEVSDERVRPLQILTGGNPRLLAIISAFAAKMSLKELMEDLMQLVDDHTEYFKSHLDNLPPIERKVYLALAELWDPATARRVAGFARLNVNKASSLLRRLMERGMVVKADGKGRTRLYQVAERMYNIYYLMRRRGAPSRRVKGLVRFMVPFYGSEELVSLTRKIAQEACGLEPELRKEHFWAYEGILETAGAGTFREKLIKAVPEEFFKMPDTPVSLKHLGIGEEPGKAQEIEAEVAQLLKEGEELKKANKLKQAEQTYRKAVQRAPGAARAWARLGKLLHENLERYEEAEEAYRKAIEIDEKYAWAWAKLGQLLHEKLERYGEAEKAYRKAIEIQPDVAWGYKQLGQVLHEKLERYEEAEEAYRKAVEIAPGNAVLWWQLGGFLDYRLGHHKEAEEAFRKVVQLDPEFGGGWERLGLCLMSQGEQQADAEKALRRAIELEPDSGWAWGFLGQCLGQQRGRYVESEAAYRKAIEIGGTLGFAWAGLGWLLHEELGRYEEAEKAYREAVKLEPNHTRVWGSIGQLLHEKLERYEEAEEAYRKAIEIDEKYVWGWFKLGELLDEKLERYDEAEEAYRKVTELEPQNSYGWVHLGAILQGRFKRYEEAEKALQKAVEIDEKNWCTWVHLGLLYEGKIERYEKAEEAYRKVIEFAPKSALGWMLLGELLRKLGERCDEWEKIYRKAIELVSGDDAVVWRLLVGLLVENVGWASEALEVSRRYVQNTDMVRENQNEVVEVFAGLAAAGYAREALEVLRGSASAEIFEPLVVGLRMYAGEDVKVAAEIMEVGKDVVKRIEQRREQIEREQKGQGSQVDA